MDDWLEILIFVIVIIANIIGGIVKAKKKLTGKKLNSPPVDNADEYYEEEFDEEELSDFEFEKEEFENYDVSAPAPAPAVQMTSFPQTTDANAPCIECPPEKADDFCRSQTLEVEDIDDDSEGKFDYGEFMRTHGKEAFILAEIILPANSRQGS